MNAPLDECAMVMHIQGMTNTTQTKKAPITLTLCLTGAEVKEIRRALSDALDVSRTDERTAALIALLDKIPASREE